MSNHQNHELPLRIHSSGASSNNDLQDGFDVSQPQTSPYNAGNLPPNQLPLPQPTGRPEEDENSVTTHQPRQRRPRNISIDPAVANANGGTGTRLSPLLPAPTLAPLAARPNNMPSGNVSGPIAINYNIPPRPKPGRKAAVDEPENKRKQQNRDSQRNFRARRTMALDNLTEEIKQSSEKLKQADIRIELTQDKCNNLRKELQEEKNRNATLQQQNNRRVQTIAALQTRIKELTAIIHQNNIVPTQGIHGASNHLANMPITPPANGLDGPQMPMQDTCQNCHSTGNCLCVSNFIAQSNFNDHMLLGDEMMGQYSAQDNTLQTAPPTTHNGFETDFTQFGRGSIAANNLAGASDVSENNDVDGEDEEPVTPPSDAIATSLDPDPCGFCTNPSNCLCLPQTPKPITTRRRLSMKKKVDTSMAPSKTKPGTCAQCQSDPEQKRFCEGLAKSRPIQHETIDADGPNAKRPRLSQLPPDGNLVSCNEAYNIYKSQPLRRNDSFDDNLQSFYRDCVRTTTLKRSATDMSTTTPDQEKRYSAYDVELADCLLQLRRSSDSVNGGVK